MTHETPARSRLEHQIGAVVFGRILVAGLDSMRAFLLARLLDKAGFGVLAVGMTWYGTAVALGTLALPDALMAILPRCGAGGRPLVRKAVGWLTGAGAVAALAICLAAYAASGETRAVLLVSALVVALDVPGQVLQAVLLGTQRHQQAARAGLILSAAASVGLLVPAVAGLAPHWLMAGFGSVAAVRLFLLFRVVAPMGDDLPPAATAQLWSMAWPLWMTSAAGNMNRSLATVVATSLLPAAAFADLSLGSQELPVVTMLPNAVAVAMLPHFVAFAASPAVNGKLQALELWHASIGRLALLMMPIWVIATLEAEPLLELLYGGAQWRSAALPFRLTALLLPLRVTTYGTLLIALGKPRQILWSQVVGLSSNALMLAALPLANTVGARVGLAAAAGTVGQVVAILWMLAALSRATATAWSSVFPWRIVVSRAALAIAAVLPALAMRAQWGETMLSEGKTGLVIGLAGRLGLTLALYVGAVVALGWVPEADRRTLSSWLRLEPLWKRQQ